MSYIQGLRRFIGHERIITPGVRAIIRDGAGRLLMQRRSDFGTWGLPAGGMELDESVTTALAREVVEETGLRVIRATPFGIYSDPKYAVTYPNGDQIQPFTLAFLVEEWSGEPVADGDESLQLAFFALDALPPDEQIHPPHRKTLLDFQRFIANGTFIVD
ncbi:MAG TPA: NUDIX domain-containing protein [Thermomicrobiales bacterium]|jgi:8-oxo-dGTP pyrophosphatase MutT (NUDIX family)